MSRIPRSIAHLVFLVTVLTAASFSTQAQELTDRQLTTAYDFSTVQMPVEIVSIDLNGKPIVPGGKIKGDDDWLRGISFTLKNVSDQPISYVNIGFKFPLPNGFVVYGLPYGVDSPHGESRKQSSPPAIEPGQTIDLVLTKQQYQVFLNVLSQAKAPRAFDIAAFYVQTVCFENQPDVIWEYGYLKRRNPNEIGRFDVYEKYVLPDKPQQ